jgi:O-methyltransferase domain
MTGRAEQEAGDVVAAYDFGGLGRLVDVGGGYGILLGTVLRAAPDLQAVLVDQPAVIRMDLHMLVLLGARERTEAQYRGLLAETGFQVRRVVAIGSPAGLSVIEATLAG